MSDLLPLVSVCIPTCNSALYLRDTLESIAKQSWPRLEVIIGDNASSDATLAIAREYARRYGWRILENEVNLGAFGNWNRLIEEASGDYVALYHSDDVYLPSMVEESVTALQRDPAVGMVGTLAMVIDENNQERYLVKLPACLPEAPRYPFDEVFRGMISSGADRIFLLTPSVMVRRRLYRELGLFDLSGRFGSSGDYEMWLRLASRHFVSVIPRPLMRYRVHAGQGSETELRRNVALPDVLPVFEQYLARLEDPALRASFGIFLDRVYLKTALKQNCRGEYRRAAATAALIQPGRLRPLGAVLRLACRLHVNLRCWPGLPWPSPLPGRDER
jgi:glycosyltransferase involved in cell wall biosynthesis